MLARAQAMPMRWNGSNAAMRASSTVVGVSQIHCADSGARDRRIRRLRSVSDRPTRRGPPGPPMHLGVVGAELAEHPVGTLEAENGSEVSVWVVVAPETAR